MREGQAFSAHRRGEPELRHVSADCVRELGALPHEHLTDTMEHHHALLLGAFHLDEAHGRAGRVEVRTDSVRVRLVQAASSDQQDQGPAEAPWIIVPWQRQGTRRHREVIALPGRSGPVRPMRTETRATLLQAIAKGRRWLEDIVTGRAESPDAIAIRERCSRRQVNATISLASLAPDIVEAAIAGRLPHGIALRDLTDLPLAWTEQRDALGISPGKLGRYRS